MALVNLTDVTVLDNPASFGSPFKLEITFQCLAPLKDGWSTDASGFYLEISTDRPPDRPLHSRYQ
jgi:hypothetical protein